MTTSVTFAKDRGTIYTVLADGAFHTQVPEGTQGAVRREYETSDGKKGVKHELVAQSIGGRINSINIYEGDYGKQLQVAIGDEGKTELTIYLSASSPFGEDFMKKLPNIDTDKDVKLTPYAFEDDKGKKRRGLSIQQGDVKIEGFYHEEKDEKIVAKNGYPEVPAEAEKWDSDDWKLYFATARKFLLSKVQEHKLYGDKELNAMATGGAPKVVGGVEYPTEQISPDEIPF